ncbi:ABC transporter substrate-binding protein [Rhodobacterales bacterium HKCCE2091]|nr:ABC transporter substrate-binding protein [Rhodobacterales bacterium HKCCE2091]
MGARLLAIGTALALTAGAAATAQDVRVGMITTLSGGGASLGLDARDGFMLAIEQDGREGLEILIEDDERSPDRAVQLADRLVQAEDVDILTGIIWSNLLMAVAPSATAQGVFYLSVNAAPSQLAGANCNPLYFSVSYQNDNLHEAAGAYASSAGYANTFIMAPNYPAGTDSLTGFKRFYEGELAGEVYTELGQTDYAAEISQIRASGADSVFIFLPGGMGIAFVRQYAESGVDIPLIGPAFSFDQGILPAMGEAALGVYNTANWSNDLDNETNAAFVASFQEAYGRLPSVYAAYGFDTANLMLSALDTASPDDAEAFQAALEAAEFDSVRGEFTFNTNHHPIQDIYVREVVMDGDVLTNRIVETAMEDRGDAYADQCSF